MARGIRLVGAGVDPAEPGDELVGADASSKARAERVHEDEARVEVAHAGVQRGARVVAAKAAAKVAQKAAAKVALNAADAAARKAADAGAQHAADAGARNAADTAAQHAADTVAKHRVGSAAHPPAAAGETLTPAGTGKPDKPAARRQSKVWAGRLGAQTARVVEEYTHSFLLDRRLYAEDIDGSIAHARMLSSIGILTPVELRAMEAALLAIRGEFERDEFLVDPGDEDVHMAVERRLGERIGDLAGKLHTARSRNDQVATDLRLYAKRVCRELMLRCAELQEALLRRAQEHRTTVLPGYTHMQRGQVVSLAHHLLAYVEMLQRDVWRLESAHDRSDELPLGSGALAGTTLPIDRRMVAGELGFDRLSGNSLDAVSDRDFVMDLLHACSLVAVHASRFAEELVLWSTAEFGFAELPDEYATGSSLMPQKKNPDVLELVRGRTGQPIGALMQMLVTLKGLPLAYNRDLQEDKQPLFTAVDGTMATLRILRDVVDNVEFKAEAMRAAASDPALVATDVAEYLVLRGVPFREAHLLVGRAVRQAQAEHRTLADLSAEDWRAISPTFDDDVVELFDVDRMLRRRELPGGPGPRTVSRALVRGATLVARTRKLVPVLARQATAAKEVGAASPGRTVPRPAPG